jgi:hypothetical protein
MGIIEKIIGFFQDWFGKLSAEGKRKLILVCTAIFVVLLSLSVIMSMSGSGPEERPTITERTRLNIPIAAEELFLPDEPDYLPGVLLERERRDSWTEQDASEYWQDPLKYGEEQWRENLTNAIDEFLERVP